MKYLMYYSQGFLKKYPLKEGEFTIGRSPQCGLIIEDELFSRQHVRCQVDLDGLIVEDLGSTNGTFVDGLRIHTKKIDMNRSFVIGSVRFYLKEGNLDEFAPAQELIPIFNELAKDVSRDLHFQETRYLRDIYREILKMLLSEALAKGDWAGFLNQLTFHLNNLSEVGDVVLVKRQEKDLSVLMSVLKSPESGGMIGYCTQQANSLFRSGGRIVQSMPNGQTLYGFPINLAGCPALLAYVPIPGRVVEGERILTFLSDLSKEIELLFDIDSGQNQSLREPVDWSTEVRIDIVASSAVMKNLINQARKIALSDIFVLILGESGTGKELFARLIHEHSIRRTGQFVALNCAAIPENLLEAELFGSERGAFTGAYARKIGKLELASGGTLVLDEIGDMPLTVQTKLLRALQEHEFYRLGGNEPIKVDLRIISLTHRDLQQLIAEKTFREDLYYRLVHHIINIPPLRDRPEDIASLINHFAHKSCTKIARSLQGFSVQAHQVLMTYSWPGNVRQLENEIKRVVNLADEGDVIGLDLLSETVQAGRDSVKEEGGEGRSGSDDPGEDLWRVLEICNWSKSLAARRLGMTYQGLHKKIKRLGLSEKVSAMRRGKES